MGTYVTGGVIEEGLDEHFVGHAIGVVVGSKVTAMVGVGDCCVRDVLAAALTGGARAKGGLAVAATPHKGLAAAGVKVVGDGARAARARDGRLQARVGRAGGGALGEGGEGGRLARGEREANLRARAVTCE